MQKIITEETLTKFNESVNNALNDGWRAVPGTTYAACGYYELSAERKRDYQKNTAAQWFYSIIIEKIEKGEKHDE